MGKKMDYICVDLETTGLDPGKDRIIEIGAVLVKDGRICDTFESFVRPGMKLSERVRDITGITDEMLSGEQMISEVIREYADFEKRSGSDTLPLLGHAVHFDYAFLKRAFVNEGMKYEREAIDTLKIARVCLSNLPSRSLSELTRHYGICHSAHRALNDAKATCLLYEKMWQEFKEREDAAKLFSPIPMNVHVKRQSPIREHQKERLSKLLKRYQITPDFELESLTRNEADRMIDNILSQYGRDGVT